ncbi:hypothetical protein JCM11251_004087 [Rhodosporidiobolus azoricus]
MANKLEKRVQGQRRSLLPLSTHSSDGPSKPSSNHRPASHKRSVSAPFSTARTGHGRSRSWLATLLKPAAEPTAPAPPPKPSPPQHRPGHLRAPAIGRQYSSVASNPYAHVAGKENEKPLPPVLRTLSPVVEERSFVSPASPLSSISSFPTQRDLQQRIASWDWSSEGAGTARASLNSGSSSRRTTLSREEGEVHAGEDARGRRENADDIAPGLFAGLVETPEVIEAEAVQSLEPLEHVEPESSYLYITALPSTSPPAHVQFCNPFSIEPTPEHDCTSAILPLRASSSLSFHTTVQPVSSSSRPPLYIDTHPPPSRKVSDASLSVYSRSASFALEEEDQLPHRTAPDPCLQSYFSPITPADLRTPLTGLAISATPASAPHLPLNSTRQPHISTASARRTSTRPSRVSSTSSQSTTTSLHPSPIFDVDIFSHPPSSVRTGFSSAFEPSDVRHSPSTDIKSPSMRSRASSASASSGSHEGTWRAGWTIDARMSRYFPPPEEGSFAGAASKENGRPLSAAEEASRIEEYCVRELERRKQERHRRYLDERRMLYGEWQSDVTFGAAV